MSFLHAIALLHAFCTGPLRILLSTWNLTKFEVKPVYPIIQVLISKNLGFLGRFQLLWNRPDSADKSTDAPARIKFEGRYVSFGDMRL